MSLGYNCWFASPPPDPQQILDQVADEYIDEKLVQDKKWLFFYESEGVFYLYYNEHDEFYNTDDTLLLTIYPRSTAFVGPHILPMGELDVRYCWYMIMGKSNIDKATEAYTRLLRTIIQKYEGDFAMLFEGSYLCLCRLDNRVYINESSGLADRPLFALLEVAPYEVGDYPHG